MADTEEPIVYVVDDDDAVRDSLKILFESYGLRVADFRSVAEFSRHYAPDRHGCMILDLHLPGTSGFDYLAARDPEAPGLPVIMITGRADSATRAQAQRLGVMAFLDKPVNDEVLLANIRQAFERR